MEDIHLNLKKLRDFHSKKPWDIAEQLGISEKSYLRLEAGQTELKWKTLCRVAEVFAVSVELVWKFHLIVAPPFQQCKIGI